MEEVDFLEIEEKVLFPWCQINLQMCSLAGRRNHGKGEEECRRSQDQGGRGESSPFSKLSLNLRPAAGV